MLVSMECETKEESVAAPVTLVAKWGKERITLDELPPVTTIAQVKMMLSEHTRILPKRQKLIGLSSGSGKVTDDVLLKDLKAKGSKSKATSDIIFQFILMGTPEEHIFVDPHEKDDLPDVIDDFELDFNAGSEEWVQHVANGQNLKKFTESTIVHVMNQPREGKPLLVLDLDHTLLDFSSRTMLADTSTQRLGDGSAAQMKRPYMDEFLTSAYRQYDLVVWSQTSWRWLETKLTELGMLGHPGYRFSFVLDKSSMFAITSTKRDGTCYEHHVKPLQIIWSKFPHWGSHNTIHFDDLSRNFALNLSSGLKVTAFYRKKSTGKKDVELIGLARYLDRLASAGISFDKVNFADWKDVMTGNRPLTDADKKSSS